MRAYRHSTVVFLLLFAASLSAQATATIILVRHAEKTAPTGDVSISTIGQARAKKLTRVLNDANIRSIFVTEFKRTKETAAPSAEKFHVEQKIIASNDIDALVADLHNTPIGSTALVVGHSNTLPTIIERLGAGIVKIEDNEYDHLFVVSLTNGRASLLVLRYGD
jgi:broad specificity phosphatase PhoE